MRRAILAVVLLGLTGAAPAGLSGCAGLRRGGVCCVTCLRGKKACGNGCVDRDQPCTKGQGCACDPDDRLRRARGPTP